MGHQHGRHAILAQHGGEVGDERGAGGLIEPRKRLVEEQDSRLQHERPRQRHALRLAAGQALQPPRGPARRDLAMDATEAEAEGDIAGDRRIGQPRLLEHRGHAAALGQRLAGVDRAAAHEDLAGLGPLEQAEHAQQRRLAAAVGADDGQHLGRTHVERLDLQREAGRIAEANAAEREQRRHAGSTWIEPRWMENSQRRSRSISRIS